MKLEKYKNNPILSPSKNQWENLTVCNPGAWYQDGKFYLLYRAAGDDHEHYIYFGLAVSEDGFNFERVSEKPVFMPSSNGADAGCVEDPRIVKFNNDFYVTYAYRPFPPGQYWKEDSSTHWTYKLGENAPVNLKKNITNTGLAITKDFKKFKRLGRITRSDLDDRDVILFPEKIADKYVILHRPKEWKGEKYGCDYPAIWIKYSDDLLVWEDKASQLLIKGEESWERKVGGSTPPLKTDQGWLTLYHGVDDKGIYRTGVMLLELENPTKVIARAREYIMEPEFDYEIDGFYNGCVFPTGNVIAEDTLYVYYGGADKYCAVATCSVEELINFTLSYQ